MLKDLHGRLRPMGFTDILDEAIEIYKSNFVLLSGVAGAIYVPYAIISGLLKRPGEQSVAAYVGTFVDAIIAVLISSIITGALTFAISERYLGRQATVGGSYKRVFSQGVFWRLIGALLLKTVITAGPVFVGAAIVGVGAALGVASGGTAAGIALIVLGVVLVLAGAGFAVWIAVKLTIVEPALLLEDLGVGKAISRSWQLLNNNFWTAFGLVLVTGVIVAIVAGLLAAPASVMIAAKVARSLDVGWGLRALNVILTGVAHILTTPIMSIVYILVYYDMRIRKEGFDLQLLAMELDAKSRGFAGAGGYALPQESPAPAAERNPYYAPQSSDQAYYSQAPAPEQSEVTEPPAAQDGSAQPPAENEEPQ